MTSAPADEPKPPAAACAIGPDLWFRREPDGSFLLGLTDPAQRRAGKIAHYRGPVAGRFYRAGEPAISLESEKWVGHLALPAEGTVVEPNAALFDDPGAINRDPFGTGWLCRWRPKEPAALETRGTPLAGGAPG